MKKLVRGMTVVVLCVLLSLLTIACGDKPTTTPEDGGDPVAPVITNKPSENKLTITEESNTYQFEIGEYDGNVTWYSSVTSVAEISASGLLTMKSAGNTEVIVKDTATDLSDSVVLTITDERLDHHLVIDGLPSTVRAGCADIQLTAKDTAVEGATFTAKWKTNNPSVATIDETTGLMSVIGKGTATITATKVDDPTLKDTLTVNVLGAAVTKVEFENVPKYGMLMQNNYAFSVKVEPADADDYEIEWQTDDETVATVDEAGVVSALTAGNCKVKAIVTGVGMTAVDCEEQYTVHALSPDSEDFRFAQMDGSSVTGVGVTIAFTEATGEIVDLNDEKQNKALKFTTADTTADRKYNHVELNFGAREAGKYKVTVKFDVLSGEHDGSILVPGESDAYATLDGMSSVGSVYSFIFDHAATGDLRIRFTNKTYKASEVIIDDISIEEYTFEALADALGGDPVTFDEDTDLESKGIYALHDSELTVSDGQLQVGNGGVAFYVGDVTKGRYDLKLDATFTGGYPAVAKIADNVGADEKAGAIWEKGYQLGRVKNGFASLAKKSGNTYTLSLSFAANYSKVVIVLCDNTDGLSGTMTLDNLSFAPADNTTTHTLADFEDEYIIRNNWGAVPTLEHAATTFMDYPDQNAWATGTTDVQARNGTIKEETPDGGETNHYLELSVAGNADRYSRLNVGYLPAGTYVFALRAKVISGSPVFALAQLVDAGNNSGQISVNSGAATSGVLWGVGEDDSWQNTITVNATEWTTYRCKVTLASTKFVKFGTGSGICTVCIDDLTVQKIA